MDNRALDRLARTNFGLMTTAEADLLFGPVRRDWLVKQRRLVPVHRGVYRVAGAPVTFVQRCAAALLAAPSDALISHLSALRLYGLTTKGSVVHLTVPKRKAHRLDGIEVHRSTVLPRDRTEIDGLSATGVARTLFDCAAVLTSRQLERAMDDAVVARLCSYSLMHRTALAVGTNGRKGAREFVTLLDDRLAINAVDVNEQELRIHRIIAKAKLPIPTSKHMVWHSSTSWYEIDISWPEYMIAIEFKGFQAHGTSRKRFDYDMERDNYLRLHDWDLIEFSAKMTDEAILSTIRTALRRKGVSC